MIILRQYNFSFYNNMLEKIEKKLNDSGYVDFDIVSSVQKDAITVHYDNLTTSIYFPDDFEYSQYSIYDFIRTMTPFARIQTLIDRNMIVLKVSQKLTEVQVVKLIKHIIDENDYCAILNDEN